MRRNLTVPLWLQALFLWSLCLARGPCAWAGPHDARQAIQAVYDKANLAAELKFLNGMLSLRAPGFEAFSPAGRQLDLSAERLWLQGILARSLSVSGRTEISSFRQLDPKNARCKAHEIWAFELVLPQTRQRVTLTLDTRSEDDWNLGTEGWKMTVCRVRQQTVHKRAAEDGS